MKGLTGAEIDTLYRLARAYPQPVEAGDLPSKTGRDDLVKKGLAELVDKYRNGLTRCTSKGWFEYERRLRWVVCQCCLKPTMNCDCAYGGVPMWRNGKCGKYPNNGASA